MATPTQSPSRNTDYGAARRPVPGASSWETFSWWFFRVSGVALIFLAVIHLVIMHIVNDVSETGYSFIVQRYANPFWRVYDLLLLTLALLHGLNGLRIVLDDYIARRGVRLAVQSALFLLCIAFWATGVLTIVTFHEGSTVLQSVITLFHH